MGKREENRSLGRPKRRWEDYIKMNRKHIALVGAEMIVLVTQDRRKLRVLLMR
jgi:hypothetical protein